MCGGEHILEHFSVSVDARIWSLTILYEVAVRQDRVQATFAASPNGLQRQHAREEKRTVNRTRGMIPARSCRVNGEVDGVRTYDVRNERTSKNSILMYPTNWTPC